MIYVFKTSVETERDIYELEPKLTTLQEGLKWNFDLEDCDNILRVDSHQITPKMIIKLLRDCNFECKELE